MSAELDSGRHQVLADDADNERALWAGLAFAAQFALLVASCVLLFLGALLGGGVVMHSLRGPHQHHPCATETRETCM